jgi:hypothetical protein
MPLCGHYFAVAQLVISSVAAVASKLTMSPEIPTTDMHVPVEPHACPQAATFMQIRWKRKRYLSITGLIFERRDRSHSLDNSCIHGYSSTSVGLSLMLNETSI